MDYTLGPLSVGWYCPRCGRVYSPTQMMCLYCGGNEPNQPYISPQGFTWDTSNETKDSITTITLNGVSNLSNCSAEGSGVDTSISQ